MTFATGERSPVMSDGRRLPRSPWMTAYRAQFDEGQRRADVATITPLRHRGVETKLEGVVRFSPSVGVQQQPSRSVYSPQLNASRVDGRRGCLAAPFPPSPSEPDLIFSHHPALQ